MYISHRNYPSSNWLNLVKTRKNVTKLSIFSYYCPLNTQGTNQTTLSCFEVS